MIIRTMQLVVLTLTLFYITNTHSVLVTPTNEQELTALIQQGPILLQFTADWCSACLRIKQTVEDVAQEKEFDSVTIARINIDLFGELATRYSIRSIPAFICINSNGTTNITRTITQDPLHIKDNLRSALRNITTHTPTQTQVQEKTTQEPVQQSASSPIAQLSAFIEYIVATTSAYIRKITDAIKQLFSK